MKSKSLFSSLLALCFTGLLAQEPARIVPSHQGRASWQEMKMNGANFYDIQKKFYREFPKNESASERKKESGEEQEKGGWELFKKWEYMVAPRVYPSGDLSQLSRTHDEYQNYLNAGGGRSHSNQRSSNNNSVQANSWSFLGPLSEPLGGGVGRGNCICIDPANSNNLWIGSPDGGLWKSTNGGTNWTTSTDLFTDLGVSDVAIDPTNSNIMYVATGDRDGSYAGPSLHAPAYGLMKSTDGGVTWTNMYPLAVSSQYMMSRILIDPSNTQNIYVSGNFGIIKSTNGGTSWSTIFSTEVIMSMEFQPGTSSTIYAAGKSFHVSTNSGGSWTTITSGLASSGSVARLSIAVSANNPAYCYVLAADGSNFGLYGVYLSTNAGAGMTFNMQKGATSPNLLGFNQNGSDNGTGQGFYTLSIGANPTNAAEVMVGGVNIWKSTNSGVSWGANAVTYWAASHTASNYVHADIHHILYMNGTTVLTATDGGISKSTNNGSSWADISNDLQIAQMYGLGMSTTNANKILSGWQDNGTNLMTSSTAWAESLYGDGMKCFVDYSNDNTLYGEQYQGSFNISTNGGGSWTGIPTGSGESTAWATPWKQDPNVSNTIYGGQTNLYKSTNQGTSWAVMGTMPDATEYINEFAIAPSNSQIVYVCKNGGVFKTTNGGGSWSTITGTIPVGSGAATYVAICPTNANIAYVTLSGFSSGNKVFVTSDGGTTWTNYSTGLPNIAANCITYQKNAHGAVYVGMDVGVYYRDSTMASWAAYNTGLPNVIVTQMEIYYATGMIRASTYGRGIWEIPVNNPGTQLPIANFVGNPTNVCPGSTVQFTDLSSYSPTSWSWTFQGGNPATSTTQNPVITYSAAGTYSVSLTATNSNGSNTYSQTAYITVSGPQALPLSEGFQTATFPPTNWGWNTPPFQWHLKTTVGHNSTQCAWFDNTDTNSIGKYSYLTTPKYNFGSLSSAKLYFDVAYAPFNRTYSDSLAVYVSTNCGVSYTRLYLKGGLTLGTTGTYDSTSAFVPTAAQWRTDTVYLNTYVGNPSVLVKFENRPGYGQAIYLDNVNITGVAAVTPVASYTVASSTICAGSMVTFSNTSTGSPTTYTWTFAGGNPAVSYSVNPVVTYTAAGTYTVTLTASNSNGSNTTSGTMTVVALPSLTVIANPSTVCSGSTVNLSASGASTYTWSANAGSATTPTVNVNPVINTTYTVTGSGGVCVASKAISVTVTPNPTVTATASSYTLCRGGIIDVFGNGASTYTWSANAGSATTSSVSVSPSSNIIYTVTGSTGGCSASATVAISVIANPTVGISATSTAVCSGNSEVLTGTGASTYSWSANAGGGTASTATVSPTIGTTYTVTGLSGSCQSTATAYIGVNPTPSVTASASSGSICSGNNTVLSGSGASTYTWSANAGGATTSTVSVSPLSNTNYTVTGTSGSCSSSAIVSVSVTTTPTVTATASPATICSGGNSVLSASGASSYTWSSNAGGATTSTVSISPSATDTYTVTGMNGSCTGSQTVSVAITSSVVVTASASSSAICAGGVDTLFASGASSYTWSPGGATTSSITVTPSTSQTYTVVGTSGTCGNFATFNVTVNSIPTTPTISIVGNVLTSTAASGNQWYLNGSAISGATSQSYTAAAVGVYSDIVTISSCSSATSNTVNVTTTGINSRTAQGDFGIYPNPSDGNFTIAFSGGDKTVYQIEIVNAIGQVIYKDAYNGNGSGYNKSINISENGKGIYLAVITWNGKRSVNRIVVN